MVGPGKIPSSPRSVVVSPGKISAFPSLCVMSEYFVGARAPRAQESVRTGFRTGGTNSGSVKGFGNCALLRSRFPVIPVALAQGEEAPDESARPAPPTSPSFKNSLRVNAMQPLRYEAPILGANFQASTRLGSCCVGSLATIGTSRIRQVAYFGVIWALGASC